MKPKYYVVRHDEHYPNIGIHDWVGPHTKEDAYVVARASKADTVMIMRVENNEIHEHELLRF